MKREGGRVRTEYTYMEKGEGFRMEGGGMKIIREREGEYGCSTL